MKSASPIPTKGDFIAKRFHPTQVGFLPQNADFVEKSTHCLGRQMCAFFWRRRRDLNSRAGKTRPTPLAGAPLRPLEYFSVYLRRERPLQNSRRLLYTRFSLLSRPFTKKRNNFFRHRHVLISGTSVPSTYSTNAARSSSSCAPRTPALTVIRVCRATLLSK